MIKQYKIINFDDYANEHKIEHNPKWSYIPDNPCRLWIIGDSVSGKGNVLLIKYIYVQKIHMKQNINI